ncbi:MAG: integration host factor subunit beta [Chitinivibrionales bacterium]|nr:integration host factor subunit beta [Chitinivibrionales bacterium]
MPNTTKHDLIAEVSKITGLTQADTKIVIEELLESISRILEDGKNIEVRGFGTFYTKIRKPRPARNPKTGEVVPLQRRVVPLFKYSNEMKKKIVAALKQKDQSSSLPG